MDDQLKDAAVGGHSACYFDTERNQALPRAVTVGSFQQRVQPWLMACFGETIAADVIERNHRFLEESLELLQACGSTAGEAHLLVDYVFGRPVGEKSQEVGGVMVTLAALCLAQGLDMHQSGDIELARIWTKVEQIRAKQAAKPQFGPLPGPSAAQPLAPSGAVPVAWRIGQFDLYHSLTEAYKNIRNPFLEPEPLYLAAQPLAGQDVRAVTGWQPIETAPKEGYMLVHEDGAIRAMLRFDGVWQHTAYPAIINKWGDAMVGDDARRLLPEGYRLELRDGCCQEPTHWMPFLAAPSPVNPKQEQP